ncbi:MAG: adenylate/guanylate cyclase domain-containing protein [Acidimicrobiia bacterium]|nr:adenylate/guanylate cyclase domain-containing protein [Acidimicrobiia bacterium]
MKSCPGPELRQKLAWREGARVGLAHGVGAVFAAVSGALAASNIPGRGIGWSKVDFIIFGAYLPVAFVACGLRSAHSYKRATVWLGENRSPTRDEQRRTLRLPLQEAAEGMVPWVVAAVIWVTLNLAYYGNSSTFAIRVGLSILLGGLATSALVYLLVERTFRPLFALALAGDVPERSGAMSVRARLMLSWALGADLFLIMIGLTFLGRPAHHPPSAISIWFLVDTGLFAGAIVLYVAARSVADPLRDLRQAVGRVRSGDLDVEVEVDDGAEVGLLQAGFNKMVAGLRERRQLQDLFGRYVGEDVAREALEHGVRLGGERREVSALFVDLLGSTTLAQTRSPDDVVDLLNRFFDIVVRTVAAEGGWVNKFEGDGALCVFGAPMAQDDHATRALRAARTIRREILALSASEAGIDAAVGVSSGTVVAGNVGAEQRYEYTVIGDPVNQAARLTDEAKHRLGRVLASEEAVARADGESRSWVVADELRLRGRSDPTLVFEPAPSASVRELL